MNKNYITDLYDKGYITDTDVHFANFIGEIDKNGDPDIFLAAALVSRATGNGDVYLDLGSVAETSMSFTLNGDAVVKCPELSEWSKKISQSRAVGKPGDFRPLILDKKNRLYLYRYWDYEKHLSDAITRRMREDIPNIDRARNGFQHSVNGIRFVRYGIDNIFTAVECFFCSFHRFADSCCCLACRCSE